MSKTSTELEAERLLIERAKSDPTAYGQIFDDHYQIILNYVVRRTGDIAVAQDLTSQVFIKALQKLPSFEWRGIPISAWLYRIAANEVRMHYRNKRPTVSLDELQETSHFEPLDERDLLAELQTAQDTIERDEMFQAARRSIASLPEKYQEVLTLRFGESKKIAEIAIILDKREGTVKSLLSRALKRLRLQIERQQMQPDRQSRIMDNEGRTIIKSQDEL